MFLHNKNLMYTVRVDAPNPRFAKMLHEQFGGPNGELAAAMRYFTQGWTDTDPARRDMLLDIATEEMSHLEMVGQLLVQLMAGTPGPMLDDVEGGYLGDMLNGDTVQYLDMALGSGTNIVGGGKPRLTDSMGTPWTAAYIDTIGMPVADLQSDIAAEVRAKIVYERLIKSCDDVGARDALNFLMTREIAHQKMFEAALEQITDRFPPGHLDGDDALAHTYFDDSKNGATEDQPAGFELANTGDFPFELVADPVDAAPKTGGL
jgi:Mn-containing catalase